MKDLFSGNLGRLNNHGGARMYTTPHTIGVPPEYEVETDIPSVAEFVTCTLDGRIWVYRRSRRYYIAVFRWGKEKEEDEEEKLLFVSTTVLSNETVIKRGVDWILTDKSFIQPSDNEPYISITELEEDDTSYIDAFDEIYSFFPDFETWEQIKNGQVIRLTETPNAELQAMPKNSTIPIEFHDYGDDDITVFTNFTPKLCYSDGKLYGKGKAHIGRVFLLPCRLKVTLFSASAVNEIEIEPETETETENKAEVYSCFVYISPDHLRDYDTENQTFDDEDGWDKLAVVPFDENYACMSTMQDYGSVMCYKLKDNAGKLIPNETDIDFSEDNGEFFFDALTSSNLWLTNNGAYFLSNEQDYACKGFQDWLAPGRKVEAISEQYVFSSTDNATIVTYLQQGFHRELLNLKNLPFSLVDYSEKRLSLGNIDKDKKKFIQVNNSNLPVQLPSANFNKVYKPIVDFDIKNIFPLDWSYSFIKAAYKTNEMFDDFNLAEGHYVPVLMGEQHEEVIPGAAAGAYGYLPLFGDVNVHIESGESATASFSAKIRYIITEDTTLETGEILEAGAISPEFNIGYTFPNNIQTEEVNYYVPTGYSCDLGTMMEIWQWETHKIEALKEGSVLCSLSGFYVHNGDIIMTYTKTTYESVLRQYLLAQSGVEHSAYEPAFVLTEVKRKVETKSVSFSMTEILHSVKPYIADPTIKLQEQCTVFLNKAIDRHKYINEAYYVSGYSLYLANYYLKQSHMLNCDLSEPEAYGSGHSYDFYNFPNSDTKNETNPLCKKVMHVLRDHAYSASSYFYFVFFSEYHPEILDLEQEIERSKYNELDLP